jgi:protoheme IX farnesyltransferase
LIIFLWTPPHYWPLSMKYLEDYKSAGVPMLPVVAKNEIVGRQIILYAWAYLAATLLLIPVAGMGLLYTLVAVIAGAWFTWESHKLYNEAKVTVPKNPMRLFHGSITHLTLMFLAIAIDPLLPF